MKNSYPILLLVLSVVLLAGCSNHKSSGDPYERLEQHAWTEIDRLESVNPTINRFFKSAAGYAVFPEVTKGGLGIGGMHGEGVLVQGGRVVGYTKISQGTIGLQAGGQVYSQIIFFKTDRDIEAFKMGTFEFSAQATAVGGDAGVGVNADYDQGVAVFTTSEKGLMFEAAIGGQKFEYMPKR